MTATELRAFTRKELETMAKQSEVIGRHGMNKEDLVKALVASYRKKKKKTTTRKKTRAKSSPNGKTNGRNGSGYSATRPLLTAHASNGSRNGSSIDTLTIQVLGAHWLAATWSLSQNLIDRAKTALGSEWHQATPILRVLDVGNNEENATVATRIKDIEIHGKVDHWYVPVDEAACTYKLQIGYRTPSGNFFALARSNKVTTPEPSSRIGALKRITIPSSPQDPDGSPPTAHNSQNGDEKCNGSTNNGNGHYEFSLSTELLIHGTTDPRSELTLLGEPVPLDDRGRFSLRMAFQEGRQVIPAVTITPNGEEKRTIVLAIERNTKKLEPQSLNEPLF